MRVTSITVRWPDDLWFKHIQKLQHRHALHRRSLPYPTSCCWRKDKFSLRNFAPWGLQTALSWVLQQLFLNPSSAQFSGSHNSIIVWSSAEWWLFICFCPVFSHLVTEGHECRCRTVIRETEPKNKKASTRKGEKHTHRQTDNNQTPLTPHRKWLSHFTLASPPAACLTKVCR